MSKANVRLRIAFDFDLAVPEALQRLDHDQLCRALAEALGPTVVQGMPVISAKQLAKGGIALLAHHHHLAAENLGASPIPREALLAAAPHLTDTELDELARRAAGRIPDAPDERARVLRRLALGLVGDFRLVDCLVRATQSSGAPAELHGRLNLTNGSVLVSDKDRATRLRPQADILLEVEGCPAPLAAECSGHTLSGPVLAVGLAQLAQQRDCLINLWQKNP